MQSRSQIQEGFIIVLICLIETVATVTDNKISGHNVPPLIHEGPPPHIYFKARNRIVLPCRASGDPAPRHYWYRNGLPLETSNDTGTLHYVRDALDSGFLHLKTLHAVTEGYYQCFAINSFGTSMSNISFVQEAVLDDRNVRGKVMNATVEEDSHLVMPCDHFESLPMASVQWFSSNESLGRKKLPVKRVVSSGRILVDSTGNLIISMAMKSDDHVMYECHAYNYITGQTSIGSFFRIILLPKNVKQNTIPELIFSSKNVIAVSGANVTLTCIFPSRQTVDITWHRKDGSLLPQSVSYTIDRQQLLLRRATWEDGGLYVCRGVNAYGETQATINLTVSEPPRLTTSLESNIVETGKSVSFVCASKHQISTIVQWFFNTQRIDNITALHRNWSISDARLTLPSVTQNDTGSFACNISNSFGSFMSNAYLIVTSLSESESYSGKDVETVLPTNSSLFSTSSYYLCSSTKTKCYGTGGGITMSEDDISNETLLDLQEVQQGTTYSLAETASHPTENNGTNLIKYGHYVQDSREAVISYEWTKRLWAGIGIMILITFILLFIGFVFISRKKKNSRHYKVYKQEQQRGIRGHYHISYDSSGYENKKHSSRSHWKIASLPVPDCECHF